MRRLATFLVRLEGGGLTLTAVWTAATVAVRAARWEEEDEERVTTTAFSEAESEVEFFWERSIFSGR
jgi:cytidylate kinase